MDASGEKHKPKSSHKEDHKHKHKHREKSSTSMFCLLEGFALWVVECASRIAETVTETTTADQLIETVQNVQNASSFKLSERAPLALYAICMNVTEYSAIPAVLERFGGVVRSVGNARDQVRRSLSVKARWRSE